MANQERRGNVETVIHYGNYVDAAVMVVGIATLNPVIFLVGAAGFGGGKVAENWLKKRRSGKMQIA